MPDPPPHFSQLIVPANEQPSISQLLSGLRRRTLSAHNRLASIRADAAFVAAVADGPAHRRRPLVANERCGSWYVPPHRKAASAYFKSTDGHERAWKFSTRRLNLHLVGLVEEHDGIIIVDSTRRGKRMPDALSTTIPIWCTVLNLTLLPSNPLSSQLFLPPHLPATTHAQVSALIPSFVASLKALNLTLPSCLSKPLRPLWITQESSALTNDSDDGSIFDDYRPVICCTASRRVVGSEMDEGGYIQGAGDDTENWAHGLTAPVFWEHAQELLDTPEAELPDLIAELMEQSKLRGMDEAGNMHKQLNPYISVCPLPIKAEPSGTTQCCIELASQTIPRDAWIKSAHHMVAGLGKNKLASRNLRLALDDICNFAAAHVHSTAPREDNIDTLVIACDTGKDLAVGVALAISCYLFNDDNTLRSPEDKPSFTKDLIKKRLGGIMAIYPEANPSRSTLQSVNSFLMDWKK